MTRDLTPILEKLDKALLAIKWARRKRELAALSRQMEPDMARAFASQGKALRERLAKENWSKLPGWTDLGRLLEITQIQTRDAFELPWRELAGEAMLAGAALTADEVGVKLVAEAVPIEGPAITIKFGLTNPRAVQWLLDHGGDMISGIEETTKLALRVLLAKAVEEGWSWKALQDEIASEFAQYSEVRAHMIAVTEIGNAYTAGNYVVGEELRDAGLTMEKSWSTMGDEKICEICLGNEAEEWISFDDAFSSGDLRPLAHPDCRCDLLMRGVHGGGEHE